MSPLQSSSLSNSDISTVETGGAESKAIENSGGRRTWRKIMETATATAMSQSAASSSSSDSPQVAKVIVSVDPLRSDDSSALQFTMEMGGNDSGHMPKSYSLNMFQDFVPMCVLSETGQGRVTMEGKVIDNDRGVNMRPMPGMIGMIASSSKDKKKAAPVKGPEVKRTRRDRGELEDIMFKLFERQPNWTLKQLVQETDQPAQFLKEILNELCVYNKRGTNQGTYELKPEYKKSVEDTGAE
ncbi:Papain family cysteine protease [Capsicum annuum]|nr:Papain family cysteine protease [Capsicum annuum]